MEVIEFPIGLPEVPSLHRSARNCCHEVGHRYQRRSVLRPGEHSKNTSVRELGVHTDTHESQVRVCVSVMPSGVKAGWALRVVEKVERVALCLVRKSFSAW